MWHTYCRKTLLKLECSMVALVVNDNTLAQFHQLIASVNLKKLGHFINKNFLENYKKRYSFLELTWNWATWLWKVEFYFIGWCTSNHQTLQSIQCQTCHWVGWNYILVGLCSELFVSLSYYSYLGYGKKNSSQMGIIPGSFQSWVVYSNPRPKR